MSTLHFQCHRCRPVFFFFFFSFYLFIYFLPQIAVSHTTACGLWQGGVPVLRGSGVRLQLGRMGMLSCLHRLLSGRLWALISLHRQRLRSMTSSSLPSLWVCVEDGVVPPPTGGCPCASWASCWNCNCRWCCCWSCWSCCFNCSCCWWSWSCCCCRETLGLQGTCGWAKPCSWRKKNLNKSCFLLQCQGISVSL